MNLSHVKILTSRLLLKPIALEYKEDIFSEFTEKITTYMYPMPAKTIAETESFINESLEGLKNGTNLQVVVLAKKSQEFLGCAGLHHLDKQPELGIWLKKTAHGNKYGLEAITALKAWADKNLDCDYFISYIPHLQVSHYGELGMGNWNTFLRTLKYKKLHNNSHDFRKYRLCQPRVRNVGYISG